MVADNRELIISSDARKRGIPVYFALLTHSRLDVFYDSRLKLNQLGRSHSRISEISREADWRWMPTLAIRSSLLRCFNKTYRS